MSTLRSVLRWSLRARLFVVVGALAISLLTLMILTYRSYTSARAGMARTERGLAAAARAARTAAITLQEFMEARFTEADRLARNAGAIVGGDPEAERVAREISNALRTITAFGAREDCPLRTETEVCDARIYRRIEIRSFDGRAVLWSTGTSVAEKRSPAWLAGLELSPGTIYLSRREGAYVTRQSRVMTAGGVYHLVAASPDRRYLVILDLDDAHVAEHVRRRVSTGTETGLEVTPLATATEWLSLYQSGDYVYLVDDLTWVVAHPKPWHVIGFEDGGRSWPQPLRLAGHEGARPLRMTAAEIPRMAEYYRGIADAIRHQRSAAFLGDTLQGSPRMVFVEPVRLVSNWRWIELNPAQPREPGSPREDPIFGAIVAGSPRFASEVWFWLPLFTAVSLVFAALLAVFAVAEMSIIAQLSLMLSGLSRRTQVARAQRFLKHRWVALTLRFLPREVGEIFSLFPQFMDNVITLEGSRRRMERTLQNTATLLQPPSNIREVLPRVMSLLRAEARAALYAFLEPDPDVPGQYYVVLCSTWGPPYAGTRAAAGREPHDWTRTTRLCFDGGKTSPSGFWKDDRWLIHTGLSISALLEKIDHGPVEVSLPKDALPHPDLSQPRRLYLWPVFGDGRLLLAAVEVDSARRARRGVRLMPHIPGSSIDADNARLALTLLRAGVQLERRKLERTRHEWYERVIETVARHLLNVDVASSYLRANGPPEHIGRALELMRQAARHARELINQMAQARLADSTSVDLVAALRELAVEPPWRDLVEVRSRFERFDYPMERTILEEIVRAVLKNAARAVRESADRYVLLRHAERPILIHLEVDDEDGVEISIEDCGPGFEAVAGSLPIGGGLARAAATISAQGGALQYTNSSMGGAVVRLRLRAIPRSEEVI